MRTLPEKWKKRIDDWYGESYETLYVNHSIDTAIVVLKNIPDEEYNEPQQIHVVRLFTLGGEQVNISIDEKFNIRGDNITIERVKY